MIERLLRDGTAVARLDGSIHTLFPVAISPDEGSRLRDWVIRENARRTIDVGLGYGIATLFICEGLVTRGDADVRHLAVDPNQETRFANCGLQFIGEAGLTGMVEFIPRESQLALPRLVEHGRTFDFAFLDGNHRFDGVFVDLIYLGRLVRPGGVVFMDDYQLPGVARAASFCIANLGWSLLEVSEENALHQWAVLRTAAVPDTRLYDYYVDF